jgi:putative hemolysin
MMESILGEVVFIFFLILANGFFSGSELAILSARKSTIARLIAAGNSQAQMVEKLQNDPHRFLATVQIGVTVVGSLASAVGGTTAVKFLVPVLQTSSISLLREAAEPLAIGLVVALVSYFSLILGELAPKTIGLQQADRMALLVAKPIHAIATIAGVVVTFLTLSNRVVLALFGVKPASGQEFITREEVLHAVASGGEAGALNKFEHKVIANMLDFTRTQVREVLVPRSRIVAVDLDLPRPAIIQLVLNNHYSRYPVYRDKVENVIGFIHARDLLGQAVVNPEFSLDDLVRPAFFVPESQRIAALLREMQQRRLHMALVVDEYGDLGGLVTIEDLLEELVGEIEDEHDVNAPPRVKRLSGGGYLVDALLPLNDVEDLLAIKVADDLPCDTLAGLVLHLLGRFPEAGEQVLWQNYLLTCVEVAPTAILRVKIEKKAAELLPG